MWNISNPIERRTASCSHYPVGGVAPLRQERALHAYIEKKLMHAEIDRHALAWALQTAIVHGIQSAVRTCGAAARRWLQGQIHPSTVVKPRG
jgi:hypothetical protein